ncbi:hypothetical protein B0H14DRAFT_2651891 [Mycena olivaceomarginata]|nr:hypothetical protein B0H14DRAFT_2651891 [Mycena olivaceomarginata]
MNVFECAACRYLGQLGQLRLGFDDRAVPRPQGPYEGQGLRTGLDIHPKSLQTRSSPAPSSMSSKRQKKGLGGQASNPECSQPPGRAHASDGFGDGGDCGRSFNHLFDLHRSSRRNPVQSRRVYVLSMTQHDLPTLVALELQHPRLGQRKIKPRHITGTDERSLCARYWYLKQTASAFVVVPSKHFILDADSLRRSAIPTRFEWDIQEQLYDEPYCGGPTGGNRDDGQSDLLDVIQDTPSLRSGTHEHLLGSPLFQSTWDFNGVLVVFWRRQRRGNRESHRR